MKVKRIICPKCNTEKKVITDRDDLHSYQEEITYKKCKHHPVTAEDKLLKALLGKKKS